MNCRGEREELLTHWNGIQVALLDAGYRIGRNYMMTVRALHLAGIGLCLAGCNLFPLWQSVELGFVSDAVSGLAVLASTTAYIRTRRQVKRRERLLHDLQNTADRLKQLEEQRT